MIKENEKILYPLKKSLKYGRDFIFVNPDVWNFIQKYFKAGKEALFIFLFSNYILISFANNFLYNLFSNFWFYFFRTKIDQTKYFLNKKNFSETKK